MTPHRLEVEREEQQLGLVGQLGSHAVEEALRVDEFLRSINAMNISGKGLLNA